MVDTLRFAYLTKSRRLPTLRRQFELRKFESGSNRAADQGPVAGALGGLPRARGHDRLRPFVASHVGAEPDRVPGAALMGDLQDQRRAGVVVPDLDRIDTVPVRALSARQQEIDCGRA